MKAAKWQKPPATQIRTLPNLNKYPLDFESLVKGDIIPTNELERITGKAEGTNEFAFKLLSLQQQISDATGYTVKISNGNELHVLTDEEASKHNHNKFQQHKKGMIRRHHLMTLVDPNQLSDSSKQEHERKLLRQGALIQTMIQGQKQRIEVKREVVELPASK